MRLIMASQRIADEKILFVLHLHCVPGYLNALLHPQDVPLESKRFGNKGRIKEERIDELPSG